MPRSANRNKDYARGLSNREKGLFKKANTFYKFYGGEIAVYIKLNGKVTTYESANGVLRRTRRNVHSAWGPDNFDTVADRHVSPDSRSSSTSSTEPLHIGSPPISWDATSTSTRTASTDPSEPLTPELPFPFEDTVEIFDDTAETSPPGENAYILHPSALTTSPGQLSTTSSIGSRARDDPSVVNQPDILCPLPVSQQRKEMLMALAKTFFQH
jgi:hypothetical protein